METIIMRDTADVVRRLVEIRDRLYREERIDGDTQRNFAQSLDCIIDDVVTEADVDALTTKARAALRGEDK